MIYPLNNFLIGKCGQDPNVMKVFIRFLYMHKVYVEYVFNYMYSSESWKEEYHNEDGTPYHFIARAFPWRETPQGRGFWNGLNDLWRCRLMFDLKIK